MGITTTAATTTATTATGKTNGEADTKVCSHYHYSFDFKERLYIAFAVNLESMRRKCW